MNMQLLGDVQLYIGGERCGGGCGFGGERCEGGCNFSGERCEGGCGDGCCFSGERCEGCVLCCDDFIGCCCFGGDV